MGKRAFTSFVHRHKILLSVLSFIFIQLPQYVDSIWSLIEHFTGTSNNTGSASMNTTWLYWITVPLGLAMFGIILWLTKKPVLSNAEKNKVIELMESVNILDDMMARHFNEIIEHNTDRVAEFKAKLRSPEFTEMWNKCSKQRAVISFISPNLSEQVRTLLTLWEYGYSHLLKDWQENEVTIFGNRVTELFKNGETIRKRIKKEVDKLII
ncbi:MAG: hypothetical protein JW856_02310 [Dehalococcoidales bacterium]|nr:hypothetical protein [Dehalococcoidales bacterium]